MTILVKHFGNTANNAFYLSQIIEDLPSVKNAPAIIEFGLIHAISSPGWEMGNFEVKDPKWVEEPLWSQIPEAHSWNRLVAGDSSARRLGRLRFLVRHFRVLQKRSALLTAAKVLWFLGLRDEALERHEVGVFYGQNFLAHRRLRPTKGKRIFLEHGTVRWADAPASNVAERIQKARYARLLMRADFILVTNLDSETLTTVRRLAKGAWCAFPHPYAPSGLAPFEPDRAERANLLLSTNSDHLILLGASHNWRESHDKGTGLALEAFKALRDSGQRVGLVTLEWGLDQARSREFLEKNGLDDFVAWLPPQGRFRLQKLAASCDLSWNQFGYDSISGFDLRMVEQGLPHVSRGLSIEAVELVGSQVPWSIAATAEGIVTETLEIISRLNQRDYLSGILLAYDSWYSRFHSPDLTRRIFLRVLEHLEGPVGNQRPAPDLWKEESMRHRK